MQHKSVVVSVNAHAINILYVQSDPVDIDQQLRLRWHRWIGDGMSNALVPVPGPTTDVETNPVFLAAAGFLSDYQNEKTRYLYGNDLRSYFSWAVERGLHPFTDIGRTEMNAFRAFLEAKLKPATVYRRLNTLQLFYRYAVEEHYAMVNPTTRLKMPRVWKDDSRKVWLNRYEVGALLRAARQSSPTDWALISLLASLGLRVTSVCNITIADFAETRDGYRWLYTMGKFSKPVLRPIPPPVLEAMEAAAGDRTEGFLLLRRDGSQMTRRSADRVIKRLGAPLEFPSFLSPHDLRRSWISNCLEAGAQLRDVQIGADHADPRSTADYDRRTRSPHGHPAMLIAGLYAAAS